MFVPKCGHRDRGRWCSVSRMRSRREGCLFAPACGRHLTRAQRAEHGLLRGEPARPREVLVDVAKLRAGDRD